MASSLIIDIGVAYLYWSVRARSIIMNGVRVRVRVRVLVGVRVRAMVRCRIKSSG